MTFFSIFVMFGMLIAALGVPTMTASAAVSKPGAWTSRYASATYPSGSVATFAAAAGSDRLLVVAIASTRTTAGSQTVSVTYGGQALTLAAGDGTSTNTWNHSYLYYLNEAGIVAAGGGSPSLNVTISGGTSYYTWVYSAVYAGVDQTTPFTSARNYNSATADSAVGPFNPTLTIADGDQAIEIVNLARSSTGTTARTISTWATGWSTAGVNPTSIVTSGPTATLYIRDRSLTTPANDGSQHTASSTSTWDSMTAMSIKSKVTGSYTYTVVPAGDITDDGTIPDGANYCADTGWPNTRYFLVNEHFTVTDLNVRFDVSHASRGEVRMILTSPADASGNRVSQTLVALVTDSNNNYDILLDADTGGALSDGTADTTADPVDRTVQQTLLNNFEGRDVHGAWRMDICDGTDNTDIGNLVTASLIFTGDPISFAPRSFDQGPAVLETYYIPWPESELWTLMGTLFYPGRAAATGDTTAATSCVGTYNTTNSNPRQPMIGYTGITLTEADTIIYYDQWEDGYETSISYPSQNTSEVWGDGDLNNGRAPGDADDVLSAGQIVILNDVKDSTAAEIIDYDARDKIAATKVVAVSRSAWSNGSTTLFAASDEVYPTSMWGTDYRLPVGENIDNDLHDSFQYTGAMVMAAVDGTVVHFDRDNNGTDEMTCNLDQGGTCQWDDKSNSTGIMGVNNVIGNGLIKGSRIYSNSGHPIQVSIQTGDVCAGYEQRSYTLLPSAQWSNQYYAPVSSNTTSRTISGTTHTLPTVVTLYNPGTSALTVNWTFGTGGTGTQSIAANSTHDVTITPGTGARFYSTGTFYAIGTVDANSGTDRDGAATDWGFTLVPVSAMSSYLIVGWAPGADPNIPSATEDSAPIWLTGGHTTTPTSTTAFTVCIDEGGNGGSLTDTITGRTYDRSISLTPFTQQIVYDNNTGVYGETGMQIWACDATNGSDAVITAAWGADPDTITSFGKPTMDMGYTIRNMRSWQATKGVSLQNDVNGNGLYDEGDTIRYSVVVKNTSGATITTNTLNVKDTLDVETTYVAGTTTVTDHNGNTTSITDGGGGAFPLDAGGSGYTYNQALPAGKSFTIKFDVTIDTTEPIIITRVNTATVTDGILTLHPDATVQIQARRLGVIGNYVWLDEDGDGDQDAGEAGIPNVKVELLAADGTTVLATTYTDANGGYLFPELEVGTYFVRTTPPANLNPTYDENGTGTPNLSTVNLSSGEEHLTADFGYNWSTTGETNTPASGSSGAIGDRIWSDADGDGLQDAEEVGISGVSVQLTNLGADGILGTADDTTSTTTTDANGNYIFDGLSAGSYVVTVLTPPAGYNQTGDPDHFGTTGTNDNKTTTPIVLGPGDVFVNADFGYVRSTAAVGSIGDTIWFDADADGIGPSGAPGGGDTSEYGIAGVTVALIKDSNGNGAWDAGEPILATDITNASGQYLFSGLPANGTEDYLVWVNDTNNVLGDLVPTYDNNGTGTPNISAVANLTTGSNLNQDFGYAPPAHSTGEGLVGDFVWLDKDGDGVQDAGEPGLEGVVVRLYDSTGALIGVTSTDENGHYAFGNLATSAGGVTYQVQVVTASLPAGLTQTGDPDATKDSKSNVSLTSATPVNLNQDFGYQGTNIISGTIWTDANADGTLSGESGWFSGVTVVLKNSAGNIVATTTTDGNGNYSFTNLPNGTYTVDVTDDANVLNGYWKSTGPNAGSDNNSQVDPYTVTVTGGQTNTTADFGYYLQPAALGNFVWEDLDGDGVQDAGEPGIPNVPVTLTIAYPGAGTTTLVTTTDASGAYSFGNLLLDEDYALADVNSGTVTLTVSASVPGYLPTVENLAGNNDQVDYDSDGASEIATVAKGETDITYDFGFLRPASIGNYVWLDEDGDGDQDAGEAGIPNLLVTLTNGTTTYTTYTDANGGYLFSDLPAGTWTVTVTPPANLNPTFDENGIGTPNTTSVTLGIGEEHLTADFGYNWSTITETNNPGTTSDNTGAIGDRVWIDADGDGKQDPEEVGIQGVDVQLYTAGPDGLFGTGDDILFAARTTDATGNYIFDNLPSDAYVVKVVTATLPAGATQTGDPDQFGITCTTCDHQTTTPIVLAPGDVFVNADFGYQVTTDTSFIGDTVWFDANGNGLYEPNGTDGLPGTTADNEYGIAGVTVSLIQDVGVIGTYEPGIDKIIATDITDASGLYLFNGIPAYANYLVWVNDTENVLGDLIPTYDSNGVNTPNLSAVPALPSAGNLNQDFGYAPANHTSGDGLIGDFVWLDKNGDGVQDAGEPGLEGVTVRLYDSFGTTLLAVTTTDENGHYSFGNLPVSAAGVTYQVQVVSASLPAGLTQTGDPDAVKDSKSTVTLTSAAPVNLNQDFGYQGTNTIGGTIWTDANADGTLSGESGWFSGVTVVLKNSAGNIVATTTTDVNGNYSFTNLPNGTYTVDVTDDANVLNGYWKTTGPSAGSDNNSQVDPYTVTVSGGQTNTTGDFGYYQQPAALGNLVWNDADNDGIQDAGETPMAGITVTLTVTYPNGQTTTLTTTTDSNGLYFFGNLLQDEDFDGVGTAGVGGTEPQFKLTVAIPSGMIESLPNQGSNNAVDSDGILNGTNVEVVVGDVNNAAALLVKGWTNPDYDFGFLTTPTFTFMAEMPQAEGQDHAILVTWATSDETEVIYFNLYRTNTMVETRVLVYHVQAQNQEGAAYSFLDEDVALGLTYSYWLEAQLEDGSVVRLSPTSANSKTFIYLPVTAR